ncbi:hypothetical protein [Microbacterium xanthum]|uniref:hypothetical protein n=1 Tax=Microbacterium xanthum TaxID=3079794 RepID=UPI002AD28B91|nr:hypothetical protein [Microbacterium sp. KSW-48]MDZ8173030.1 hypothetical protein [Microbacterium sp. KSW-48]
MSTDARAADGGRRLGFAAVFAIVVAALAILAAAGAAISVAQGPRVTEVAVDPAAAVDASGTRLIFTTTQSLQDVDPSQVTVTPDVPFAVDTSGRSVGVRFTLPLWDETEYTVTIDGVTGIGGGPSATLTETFTTPAIDLYLLQRGGEDGDTVFVTDLGGEQALPVFTHPAIEDFRVTADHLVISVRDDEGHSQLIVTDHDGEDERTLDLPGAGTVANLQAADRGDRIGYTYTDAAIGTEGAFESALFTASVDDSAADEAPVQVVVEGSDPRVDSWSFVPDTDSVLFVGFDSALTLTGPAGENPASFGLANTIAGITPGTSEAIIDRPEGWVVLDLSTGDETGLVQTADEIGTLNDVVPIPGGGTLRTTSLRDGSGQPIATSVATVDVDGAADIVMDVPNDDAVLQTCVSPSGRYAAVLVAPDVVSNRYDGYLLPLPDRVETHIVSLDTAEEVVALSGFDASWCRLPPR